MAPSSARTAQATRAGAARRALSNATSMDRWQFRLKQNGEAKLTLQVMLAATFVCGLLAYSLTDMSRMVPAPWPPPLPLGGQLLRSEEFDARGHVRVTQAGSTAARECDGGCFARAGGIWLRSKARTTGARRAKLQDIDLGFAVVVRGGGVRLGLGCWRAERSFLAAQ